jgi:D-beta-D-heptose 7-phosphate kinase/D-beta-D-heptose 1-phosphate adenosyltransferase
VVSALSSVDAVILFDSATPLALIEALRPDVLVKGGDYSRKDIVGAREVESWGGRVVTVPLVEGYSTTSMIEKVSDERTRKVP